MPGMILMAGESYSAFGADLDKNIIPVMLY